jgi:Flp pilus assembly protein TadB
MLLAEPWALAAGAVIAAEVGLYVRHERRRRARERETRISRRALDRLNGRRQ